MEAHTIHTELLRRRVRVLVVGCGGTGSAIAAGLPYLHQAMTAGGHPGGLDVNIDGWGPHFTYQLGAPTFCAVRDRPKQSGRIGEPAQPFLGV